MSALGCLFPLIAETKIPSPLFAVEAILVSQTVIVVVTMAPAKVIKGTGLQLSLGLQLSSGLERRTSAVGIALQGQLPVAAVT